MSDVDAGRVLRRSTRVKKPPQRYEPIEKVEDDYGSSGYEDDDETDWSSSSSLNSNSDSEYDSESESESEDESSTESEETEQGDPKRMRKSNAAESPQK